VRRSVLIKLDQVRSTTLQIKQAIHKCHIISSMGSPLTFDTHGLLPPGDYEFTFEELRRSLLVRGPGRADSTWDTAWRESLVGNLEVMTRQLWQVGISCRRFLRRREGSSQ
jgi:hypothetical protein